MGEHANEEKHDPIVVPCDCNAKDIHPSCGCPGNEGMGDLSMNKSSATGGVEMKTVAQTTVVDRPSCGCCGLQTCTCCTKKIEYQKPKMVESLTVKLSDCACVGLPACACNTKAPVDVEAATSPKNKSIDESTVEKLEDLAVGEKPDVENDVEEKEEAKKQGIKPKMKKEVVEEEGKREEKKEEKKEVAPVEVEKPKPKKDLKKELAEMEKKILGKETKKEEKPKKKEQPKKEEKPKAEEPKKEDSKGENIAATGGNADLPNLVKQMDDLDVKKIQLREKLTKHLAALTLRRAALVKRCAEIDLKLANMPTTKKVAPVEKKSVGKKEAGEDEHHTMTMKRLGSLEASQGKLMAGIQAIQKKLEEDEVKKVEGKKVEEKKVEEKKEEAEEKEEEKEDASSATGANEDSDEEEEKDDDSSAASGANEDSDAEEEKKEGSSGPSEEEDEDADKKSSASTGDENFVDEGEEVVDTLATKKKES